MPNPDTDQPLHRSLSGLGREPAAERADADGRVRGDVPERQVPVGLELDPGEHVVELGPFGNCILGGLPPASITQNELRLTAAAVQRRDGQSGGVGGDRGAVVDGDDVQTQVQARRCARRRQHPALVDVEHIGVQVTRRERRPGSSSAACPVCRRPSAVEQAGGGQGEGARSRSRRSGRRAV